MRMPGLQEPKSVSDIVRELWELAQGYARQETLDPLRNLGRYLGYGFAGAVLIAGGGCLLALALLRLLQTLDPFEGFWSFAPYLIVLVVLALAVGLMGRSVAASFESGGDADAAAGDQRAAG